MLSPHAVEAEAADMAVGVVVTAGVAAPSTAAEAVEAAPGSRCAAAESPIPALRFAAADSRLARQPYPPALPLPAGHSRLVAGLLWAAPSLAVPSSTVGSSTAASASFPTTRTTLTAATAGAASSHHSAGGSAA